MKKQIQMVGLTALIMTVVGAGSVPARTTGPVPTRSTIAKVCNTDSEKSCTVTIKYSNGDPAESVTVTAAYSGYSGGQHDFKTNDRGVVTLTWDSNEIKCLFIKGNKYEVNYSDGKSYTLTLKQKNKYD